MKKKPPVLRFPKPKAVAQSRPSWHNGGDIEIGLYARSLHKAAKTLIATLDLQPNPKTAWDACPVILLYRQSVELHLKALVDEGGNFLQSPTDPLSLDKTHSLRWLAQIVVPDHQGRSSGRTNSNAKVLPALPTSAPWSTNSKPWTLCRVRCILITVVLMVGCRINYSRPTWCNSQRSWTPCWTCWM